MNTRSPRKIFKDRRAAAHGGMVLLAAFLLLFWPGTAAARLIELEDFSWGLPLLEVERRAQDHGYTLREKDITQPEPRLEYRAPLRGRECRLIFSFTPLTGKLHSVTAAWDGQAFAEALRESLIQDYGQPREEIPGAGISIWTRRNTELTLRSGRDRTTLTYCQILLRQEAREERKILREKEVKR